MDEKKCCGNTLKGKQCGKLPIKNTKFCNIHTNTNNNLSKESERNASQLSSQLALRDEPSSRGVNNNPLPKISTVSKDIINPKEEKDKVIFNDDCPICLLSEGKMHIAECGHQIHINCVKGMNSLECPLCKKIITNYPLKIQTIIIKNKERAVKKQFEEELQDILEEEFQEELREVQLLLAEAETARTLRNNRRSSRETRSNFSDRTKIMQIINCLVHNYDIPVTTTIHVITDDLNENIKKYDSISQLLENSNFEIDGNDLFLDLL